MGIIIAETPSVGDRWAALPAEQRERLLAIVAARNAVVDADPGIYEAYCRTTAAFVAVPTP